MFTCAFFMLLNSLVNFSVVIFISALWEIRSCQKKKVYTESLVNVTFDSGKKSVNRILSSSSFKFLLTWLHIFASPKFHGMKMLNEEWELLKVFVKFKRKWIRVNQGVGVLELDTGVSRKYLHYVFARKTGKVPYFPKDNEIRWSHRHRECWLNSSICGKK